MTKYAKTQLDGLIDKFDGKGEAIFWNHEAGVFMTEKEDGKITILEAAEEDLLDLVGYSMSDSNSCFTIRFCKDHLIFLPDTFYKCSAVSITEVVIFDDFSAMP